MSRGNKFNILKKRIISVFSACLLVLTCVVYAPPATAAVDYTPAPSTDITAAFTDANFLAEVRTKVGKPTGSILYSDVSGITEISIMNKQISSLNGIEYFTALTYLECVENQLITLDVSKNTALTYLGCANNQLTTLDLSPNTALIYLFCSFNPLTTLDVSKNTALEYLSCSFTPLTTLDVSKNTALTVFYCAENQLATLDVSKNTALTFLQCDSNQLTTLDISKNTALDILRCENNQLTTLDVSKNIALGGLSCYNNQLTTLDISKNNALTLLEVHNNYLPSKTAIIGLNESKLTGGFTYEPQRTGTPPVPDTDITAAFTDPNFLAEVRKLVNKPTAPILYNDVSGITKLIVNNKQISSLNGIEYFTALKQLECYANQLTTLDLSQNTALTNLTCDANQLTTLNVSKNTALQSLGCSNNQLTTLDVSKNTALIVLHCQDNQLTTLDVSKNTALTNLECGYNKLTTLDVSKNTALEWLYCNNNRLTTLDVSKNTALTTLACHRNQLTTLDVSKNTALIDLRCWNNQLTTLELSKNTALRWLYGGYNQLTTLDVSKNTALQDLDCSSNQLTTLDISKNTALTHLQVQYNYLPSKTAIIGLVASGLIERADVNALANNGGGYIYEPQQTGTPTPTPPSPPAPPSGGEYNPDPGDVIQVPVLPGDYDVPGSCTDPTVVSKIDFMNEVLIVPDNYYIGAYSIDGGRSWKSGSPIDSKIAVPVNGFRGGFITKFLNKGGALVLAEGFNPATKQPVGTRIVFPNVEPRPKALKLQANYEAVHKESGTMKFSPTTPNYWTLTERNKDAIIFEHMLIMKSTNGKDMNSIWVTMPKAGIAVANPSGTTRRAETTTYFVSTAPIITSNLITPKSKVVKIKVKSAIAIRPLSFNKKTGACKFSVGTAVSTVSKTEIFSKGSTYTPSDTDAMTGYVLLPTAKNPASIPVIIG
ncbi:hypothetical protein FACS1894202_09640 [Clostridia bacterium]|nr:hypothetical protein FACS1894202_09640 [Clostridia bacterium]